MQEHLIDLYFIYVHPLLPIVHKRTFMEGLRKDRLSTDLPYSGGLTYQDAASDVSTLSQDHCG